MIANAIFAAAGLTLALVFFLLDELRFLITYRLVLIHQCGTPALLCSALRFINLTAVAFTLGRRFFLKDTGRKRSHFDRELNAGGTPMPPRLHREELQRWHVTTLSKNPKICGIRTTLHDNAHVNRAISRFRSLVRRAPDTSISNFLRNWVTVSSAL